jgi:hypothetical protein
MNYTLLRQWIADTLNEIPGLQADPRPPGTIHPPHAFVQRIQTNPHQTFDGEQCTVEVALLLGKSDEETAWDTIDLYVTSGTSSIIDALEDAAESGFDSVEVTGWETVGGDIGVNDIPYIGVVFTLDVVG